MRPAERLVTARPVAPGLVSDHDLDALRTFASGPLDDRDAAFLEALGTLADLSSSGSDDADVMAAEEAVRAFPAAQRFRAAVFAAARGRLIPAPGAPLDGRLVPWLSAGSELTIRVPVPAPGAHEIGPAGTEVDGAEAGGGAEPALAEMSASESTPGDVVEAGVVELETPLAAGAEPPAGQP